MRYQRIQVLSVIFIIFTNLTTVFAYDDYSSEDFYDDETIGAFAPAQIESRVYLISWQAKRAIRKILRQMPCGWPQYGIPPLAPYKNDNLTWDIKNDFISAFTHLQPLQIDGLNDMDIDKLVVNLLPRKTDFDFNFSNITTTGKFHISWICDLLRNFGYRPKLQGQGDLDIMLENLRFNGTLKYQWPVLYGSLKIHSLELRMSLGNVRANLSGTLNRLPITKLLNRQIEKYIAKFFNEYEPYVSPVLAKMLETQINQLLDGKTLWKLLWWSLTNRMDEDSSLRAC